MFQLSTKLNQSECKNNCQSQNQFLMVSSKRFEIKMRLLYLHGEFQTILRCHKYTVNGQLQYQVS